MNKKRTQRKAPRFDRSDFISLLAVLISLGALGVSLYEARILREQQQLMQEQQAASVWPYLEHEIVYTYDTEKAGVQFAIANKGVGPARIDTAVIRLQGQTIEDYSALSNILRDFFPPDTPFTLSYASPSGVLSADETYRILQVSSPRFPGDAEYYRKIQLDFQLCYCSIYSDCWTLTNETGEPAKGCF